MNNNSDSRYDDQDYTLRAEEVPPERPQQRRSYSRSARDFLNEELVKRAATAHEHLKLQLSGVVQLLLYDLNDVYAFQYLNSVPVIKNEPATAPDCTISLSEKTFLRIAAGDLNPQIAMLTNNIRIKGQGNLAIYFFNLIAPK